jgi:hypothetical protein
MYTYIWQICCKSSITIKPVPGNRISPQSSDTWHKARCPGVSQFVFFTSKFSPFHLGLTLPHSHTRHGKVRDFKLHRHGRLAVAWVDKKRLLHTVATLVGYNENDKVYQSIKVNTIIYSHWESTRLSHTCIKCINQVLHVGISVLCTDRW